jgi:hypothetical protein
MIDVVKKHGYCFLNNNVLAISIFFMIEVDDDDAIKQRHIKKKNKSECQQHSEHEESLERKDVSIVDGKK